MFKKKVNSKKLDPNIIKLRPFKFDSNCIQTEETDEQIFDDINHINTEDVWHTIDEEMTETNHFCQTLYLIFKTRFLIPISEIEIKYEKISKLIENEILGKILISDKRSFAILTNIIKMETLKKHPIGISCHYYIDEDLPKDLTDNYHIIYLLCINELNDNQFNQIKSDILTKDIKDITIFSTYIFSDIDMKRINELNALPPVSKVLPLGAFDCIDHNIVIIDNNSRMNWLTDKRDYLFEKNSKEVIDRIGKRLMNLFESLGEFPAVFRFMKNFNKLNEMIAETVVKQMKNISSKRRENNEPKHNSNYEFLIVDRSIDFLTPIKHSIHFRPFVYNELEIDYQNDMDLDYCKLKHISFNEISIITKILEKISEREKNDKNLKLNEKTNNTIKRALKMIETFSNKEYLEMVSIEKRIIDSDISSSITLSFTQKSVKEKNKYFKNLINNSDRIITNNDIIRFLIIYRLLDGDINKSHIKYILSQEKEERKIDPNQIEDYVYLVHKFCNSKSFPYNESVFLSITEDFNQNRLSEELFPIIHKKKNLKPEKRKLIVFVLGGLSYSDLVSIPEEYQNDIIFCSDALITAQMLFNAMLFE